MLILGSSVGCFLRLHFSVVNTKAGSTTKLANIAKVSVTEINPPKAIVPPKLDKVKIAKPKIKTTDV